MRIGELKGSRGAVHARKRVGRGTGSGHGKTSCRGHKGQLARSGTNHRAWFEGGQMPLQRRVPKRGFNNVGRQEVAEVTLAQLARFEAGTVVDRELLIQAGLLRESDKVYKLIGNEALPHALTVKADAASKGAKAAITAAGGTVEVATCSES